MPQITTPSAPYSTPLVKHSPALHVPTPTQPSPHPSPHAYPPPNVPPSSPPTLAPPPSSKGGTDQLPSPQTSPGPLPAAGPPPKDGPSPPELISDS